MSVIDRLASSLNRRDEIPNQDLANEIVASNNKKAISELVENLNGKNRAIQNDCIKVLYEIGEQRPALIAGYLSDFLELLQSKNNRLQWGAMTALNCIARVDPQKIHDNLSQIVRAAEKGSVITRDNAVNILIVLASTQKFSETVSALLIKQLADSPPNQLPMYAERILPIVNNQNRKSLIKVLERRLPDMSQESKRRRVQKVLMKLSE